MKRSTPLQRKPFKRKAPERKAEGSPELARALTAPLATPAERPRARMAALLGGEVPVAAPKTPDPVDMRIRRSAKGEDCLIRLPGCPADRAMTIWSHNRHHRAGKGGAMKAICINGCYGCTYCDGVYDGQIPRPPGMTREQVELAWYEAHAESLVRLRQKGLV